MLSRDLFIGGPCSDPHGVRTQERHLAGLPTEEAIRAMAWAWAWALASALDGTTGVGAGRIESGNQPQCSLQGKSPGFLPLKKKKMIRTLR